MIHTQREKYFRSLHLVPRDIYIVFGSSYIKGELVDSDDSDSDDRAGGRGKKSSSRSRDRKRRVGDRVSAKCSGWTKYFEGEITKVNSDGTYAILFDDGEKKKYVSEDEIKGSSGGREGPGLEPLSDSD